MAVLLSLVVLFAPSADGTPTFPGADKLVHLLLFALLAGTLRWRFGPALVGLGIVAVYAVASELIQGFALPNRSGDPLDVVADLAGVAAGWLLACRLLTD